MKRGTRFIVFFATMAITVAGLYAVAGKHRYERLGHHGFCQHNEWQNHCGGEKNSNKPAPNAENPKETPKQSTDSLTK